MLNPDDVARVAAECVRQAREFFVIDPAWKVYLKLGQLQGDARALITITADYLYASITVDPMASDDLAEVWGDVGHEVAHLVLADLENTRAFIEQDEAHGSMSPLDRSFRQGVERAVVRLERLWLRERPYQPES